MTSAGFWQAGPIGALQNSGGERLALRLQAVFGSSHVCLLRPHRSPAVGGPRRCCVSFAGHNVQFSKLHKQAIKIPQGRMKSHSTTPPPFSRPPDRPRPRLSFWLFVTKNSIHRLVTSLTAQGPTYRTIAPLRNKRQIIKMEKGRIRTRERER